MQLPRRRLGRRSNVERVGARPAANDRGCRRRRQRHTGASRHDSAGVSFSCNFDNNIPIIPTQIEARQQLVDDVSARIEEKVVDNVNHQMAKLLATNLEQKVFTSVDGGVPLFCGFCIWFYETLNHVSSRSICSKSCFNVPISCESCGSTIYEQFMCQQQPNDRRPAS